MDLAELISLRKARHIVPLPKGVWRELARRYGFRTGPRTLVPAALARYLAAAREEGGLELARALKRLLEETSPNLLEEVQYEPD